MNNSYIFISFFILFISCNEEKSNSKDSKIENLAGSVFDSKEESKSKIFISEVVGKEYTSLLEIYGKPSNCILVNSSSAKGRMPFYLVNYFNSVDSLVTAKVCRWHSDSIFRKISFKKLKGNWISIGGSIQQIKNVP